MYSLPLHHRFCLVDLKAAVFQGGILAAGETLVADYAQAFWRNAQAKNLGFILQQG